MMERIAETSPRIRARVAGAISFGCDAHGSSLPVLRSRELSCKCVVLPDKVWRPSSTDIAKAVQGIGYKSNGAKGLVSASVY